MTKRSMNRWRKRGGAVVLLVAMGAVNVVGTMPASAALPPAQSIAAVCAAADGSTFTDIGGSVHMSAIECVAAAGIAKGIDSTRFNPDGAVTRGQMASFIARTIDEANELENVPLPDLPQSAADRFSDDTGSLHEASINRLAAADIVKGRTSTQFAPTQPVSRAQMATFINNAQRFLSNGAAPFVSAEDYFTDDNTNLHEDNINGIAGAGVAQGVDGTRYVPDASVIRAQMATFIARYLGVLEEAGAITPIVGQSNATLTFAPTTPARVTAATEPSGADDTTFTATGLSAGQAYRVDLVDQELVTVDPGPVYTFTEDGNSGFANIGSVGARIIRVNGAPVADTQSAGGIIPASGQISVVVDASSFGRLLPVIFTDQGAGQTRLNLDDQNRPSEPFGVAGQLETIPQRASTGALGTDFTVLLADEAADLIVGTTGTSEQSFLFDANDRFFLDLDAPANEVTLLEFERLLNRGDRLDANSFYQATPSLGSRFILENVSPGPPTPTLSAVGETTAVILVNDLLPGAQANVYLGPDGAAFAGTTVKASSSVDGNPNEPGFQVLLSDLTASTSYEYYVTQTDDGEESDPLYTNARVETQLITTAAVPPSLNAAGFNGARPTNRINLDFSEPVTPAAGAPAKVSVICTKPPLVPPLPPTTTFTGSGTAVAQVDADTLTVTLNGTIPADGSACTVTIAATTVTDSSGSGNAAQTRAIV